MKGCNDLRVVVCRRAWSKAAHSLFGFTNESSSTYLFRNNHRLKGDGLPLLIQNADQIQTAKILTLKINFAELQSLCRIHFNRNVVLSVRFAKLSTKSCCKTSLWTMCSSRIEFYNEKMDVSLLIKWKICLKGFASI